MKEEVKNWLDKARGDFDTAKYLFKGKKYEDSSFFCPQSVEKPLKAVILSRTEKIIKTHDLVFLANQANLPSELKENCKELTMSYIVTRYPDTTELVNNKERTSKYIEFCKEVLEWVKQQL